LEGTVEGKASPALTPNDEIRADPHEPWLTARYRLYPSARAR